MMTRDPRRFTLTAAELDIAAYVAGRRTAHAIASDQPDRLANGRGHDMNTELTGVAGEMAAARFLNQYWHPNWTRTFPDVGRNVEVRTTVAVDRDCRVKRHDPPAASVVLVTVSLPWVFVQGWVRAGDVQNEDHRQPSKPAPATFTRNGYYVAPTALRDDWAALT